MWVMKKDNSLKRCVVALLHRLARRNRKGASDVFSLLLQALDDGQLTDSLGRKVDFGTQ